MDVNYKVILSAALQKHERWIEERLKSEDDKDIITNLNEMFMRTKILQHKIALGEIDEI